MARQTHLASGIASWLCPVSDRQAAALNTLSSRKQLYVLIPNLNMGGAERVVVTFLRHIDRSKFDCCLVVLGDGEGAMATILPPDLRVIALNRTRVSFSVPALVDLLWRSQPELVFSNLSHLNLILAMTRFLMPRTIKFIARESSVVSINMKQYRAQSLWRFLYNFFYHRLDMVICQTAIMQNDIVTNFSVPIEKTVIIQNPVDVENIRIMAKEGMANVIAQPSATRFRFVFVGGLRPEKRVDRLLRAFALIPPDEAGLDIVGDGPERQILHQLCDDLGLAARTRFVGFQANPYGWIKAADALLLTSDYEGAPNVVLEALALGTPVISTPASGGVREILLGQPGCVIANASTSESFAKAVNCWLNLRDKVTSEQAVEGHSVARITRQYEDQFLGLLS